MSAEGFAKRLSGRGVLGGNLAATLLLGGGRIRCRGVAADWDVPWQRKYGWCRSGSVILAVSFLLLFSPLFTVLPLALANATTSVLVPAPALAIGSSCDVIRIDFQKAFGNVWHERLLKTAPVS